MPRTMHCLVEGRVQGVAYRAFVLDEARDLGLTGFARNLPDGRVEVLAQGQDQALAELEKRLRKGPFLARVDAVDVAYPDHEARFEDFRIRR
ncbi:acylphosphatase [Fundidesulfovibrio terrae]|uniref:acylphosphatase n=1 Tax=Fundidesulfovibrio terrae TaxID=2922866 RepID=UPI001FB03F75|nr:acylphosphatase [Fundidesulfovibrio terrae]